MIITLESLKSYLKINSPNSDAELAPITAYVNSFIVKYCGLEDYPSDATARTGRYSSSNGRSVLLPHLNIDSIISVSSSGKVLEPEDYYLDKDTGILIFYTEVSTKPYAISVEYMQEAYNAPEDLVFAGLELAKYFYKNEYKNSISSGQGDQVSYEISKSVPNKIRHVLALNRIM